MLVSYDEIEYHGFSTALQTSLQKNGQLGNETVNIDPFLPMSLLGLLLLLLIASICGGIGQSIAGYSLGGCLVSIVVGFIGALIGKWIAAELGLAMIFPVTIEGEVFPVLWSILGAALFTVVVGMLTRGRSRR